VKWEYDDGGRKAEGYKGHTSDCATRAIAIAANLTYQDVYNMVNDVGRTERCSKRKLSRSSASTGVYKNTMHRLMKTLGWSWIPTMFVGSGCELPPNKFGGFLALS
jgi:hypothetical protein